MKVKLSKNKIKLNIFCGTLLPICLSVSLDYFTNLTSMYSVSACSVYNHEHGGSDCFEITYICLDQNFLKILQNKTMLFKLNTPYDSYFHK